MLLSLFRFFMLEVSPLVPAPGRRSDRRNYARADRAGDHGGTDVHAFVVELLDQRWELGEHRNVVSRRATPHAGNLLVGQLFKRQCSNVSPWGKRDTDGMRATDLARLSEPYPEDADPPDSGAGAALGMELPNWRALEADIFTDFAEQPPYGIGWWAPDPGTSRRILIADQLYCCAASVEGNMTEAALHWLEFLDVSDRDSARYADAVQLEDGRPTLSAPRPQSPLDQLSPVVVRIHYAGIVRGLASALDCLAGVVIGVAALPVNILLADFARARAKLNRINGPDSEGAKAQAQLAAQIEANIAAAGPAGWLEWTLDFRNMLIHRGRRLELGQFIPKSPVLYGADAKPVLRARRVNHLPRDPGRSDIEVLVDNPWTYVLTEDDERTLRGLIKSTQVLLEATARDLIELWDWRRRNTKSLRQPLAQWPKGRSIQSTGFDGYAPGTVKFDPKMGISNAVVARRFRAAALVDESRADWANFD
jgi:hypothetical protein